MSSMEPEVRDFLKRIVYSVCGGLCWLIINMTMGIYFGMFFIDDRLRVGNILFYFFFVASLGLLVWFLQRTWKTRFPHG